MCLNVLCIITNSGNYQEVGKWNSTPQYRWLVQDSLRQVFYWQWVYNVITFLDFPILLEIVFFSKIFNFFHFPSYYWPIRSHGTRLDSPQSTEDVRTSRFIQGVWTGYLFSTNQNPAAIIHQSVTPHLQPTHYIAIIFFNRCKMDEFGRFFGYQGVLVAIWRLYDIHHW